MTDGDLLRWVFDSTDSFAHVLTTPERGVLVTICGRAFPVDTTPTFSVPPSLSICRICQPSGRVKPPPATFPTPTHY